MNRSVMLFAVLASAAAGCAVEGEEPATSEAESAETVMVYTLFARTELHEGGGLGPTPTVHFYQLPQGSICQQGTPLLQRKAWSVESACDNFGKEVFDKINQPNIPDKCFWYTASSSRRTCFPGTEEQTQHSTCLVSVYYRTKLPTEGC